MRNSTVLAALATTSLKAQTPKLTTTKTSLVKLNFRVIKSNYIKKKLKLQPQLETTSAATVNIPALTDYIDKEITTLEEEIISSTTTSSTASTSTTTTTTTTTTPVYILLL